MALATSLKQAVPNPVKHHVKRLLRITTESAQTERKKPWEFWVDVVSGCNLRCTACPVGMPEFTNSIGQSLREMDLDLFEQICIKAKTDTDGNCTFGLYNWTEPTLHSRLHELIACAMKHDIPCGISSNLNHDYDWALLKPLRLANFTITVSGFTQKTYAINHRGGRIEPILANLIRISEVLGDWESYSNIDVRYLVHRDNQHEVHLFKHFCDKLGLKFTPYHAYYMPMEKMIEGLSGIPEGFEYIQYTPQMVSEAIGSHRSQRCFMRDSQVCLDVDGNYSICCVESPSAPRTGSYLTTSFGAMQKARFASSLCKTCTSTGLNIFATYAYEEPEEIRNAIKQKLPMDLNSLPSPPRSAGSA
jgi:pyruvate-formate lyase-activating enzyme